MSKRKTKEEKERNRIAIDDWLENKVYEMSYESFLRIKYSLAKEEAEGLTQKEMFVRCLARFYRKKFGKWPTIFRA